MPSLDDLKKRIKSVKSTQKITKAMKMVAAAKLRKAQEKAESGRPYSEKMNKIIMNLVNDNSDKSSLPKLMTQDNNDNTHLFVIVTSDRGLCGGFNTNICKLAKLKIKSSKEQNKNIKIITVGLKAQDQFKRDFEKSIIKSINFKGIKEVTFNEAEQVSKIILQLFNEKKLDKAYLFYNKFKNVITQIPTVEQIIPIKLLDKNESLKNEESSLYEFEPEKNEILEEMLPKNLSTQIFKAFLENGASEQGSRMTAMDNATRNAGDLVDKLTINYNRSRQASITKELIEIISGAESL